MLFRVYLRSLPNQLMDQQNIECMWMLSENGFIDDFLHLGILSSTVIATN